MSIKRILPDDSIIANNIQVDGYSTTLIAPNTTNTGALGSSSLVWNNGYLTSTNTNTIDTITGTALSLGGTTATSIAVGRSGITTTITGGLTQQTGAFSLTGNASSTITTSAGNNSIDAYGILNLGRNTTTSVQIGYGTITTALVSSQINIGPGNGGTNLLIVGSTQSTVDTAGVGLTLTASQGGVASATVGGAGGFVTVRGAAGGNGVSALNPGAGGVLTLQGGTAGTGGTGNANSGSITLNIPAAAGSGSQGQYNFQSAGVTKVLMVPSTAVFAPSTTNTGGLGNSSNVWGQTYSTSVVSNSVDAITGTTLFLGSTTATATAVGSANTDTYLGGASNVTGTGKVRTNNAIYSIANSATAGTTSVNSPYHYFQSSYWDGSTSQSLYGGTRTLVTSAGTGFMEWGLGFASPNSAMRLDGYGNLSLLASGNLDTIAAGALNIGKTTATSIGIGKSGVTTTITGGLIQLTGAVSLAGNAASSFTTSSGVLTLTGAGGITADTGASGTINLGTTNSTTINIGNTGSAIRLNGNTTIGDTKTLTGTYINAGAAAQSLISLQNSQASTSPAGTNIQQWSPFQELTGHGWTYLPGVVTTNMSRSAGSAPWTVTVTTGTAHGYSSGINYYLYIGDGYFLQGTYGPITVTGSTTFTYTTSSGATSGGSAVNESIAFNIYDATGQDQTVKVRYGMRIPTGTAFVDANSLVGMASPDMLFQRSRFPNNGSYGDWFKLSATNAFTGLPYNQTAGVSLQTVKIDGVTPGSFLSLAPNQISLFDDNSQGFVSLSSAITPNNTGTIIVYGGGFFPAINQQLGSGLGQPASQFNDIFSMRGNFTNVGIGNIATINWGTPPNQITTLSGWHSAQGLNYGPYGLSQLGGQTRFAALVPPVSVTVTPTGGSATPYTYLIMAIDRNGYVSGTTTGTTSSGPATRSAAAFNTITWTSVLGAVSYDIYTTSVSQGNWLGNTTTTGFKDTGAARYSSPGAGTIAIPSMLTSLWTSQGGGGAVSSTYAIYAIDADNHIVASITASASFNALASLTNSITVAWTPVGGAAGYIIAKSLNKIIGYQTQVGIQIATGTTTSSGLSKTSGSAVVTATFTNGHGLRVNDSVVISALTDTTHFAAGTFTVIAVTSATIFTYNDGGSTVFSGTTQGTFTGPGIVTSNFIDYGYPTRSIGSGARNNTADVTIDGAIIAQQLILTTANSQTGVLSGVVQLGTSPTPPTFNGADSNGTIVFSTGSTPTSLTNATTYAVATITYSIPRLSAPGSILISPANTAAALACAGKVAKPIIFYADSNTYQNSTTSWTLNMITGNGTGTETLTAGTQYIFSFLVI